MKEEATKAVVEALKIEREKDIRAVVEALKSEPEIALRVVLKITTLSLEKLSEHKKEIARLKAKIKELDA